MISAGSVGAPYSTTIFPAGGDAKGRLAPLWLPSLSTAAQLQSAADSSSRHRSHKLPYVGFSPYANPKQHLHPTPKCLYGNTVVQVYYLYIDQVARTAMTGHNRRKVISKKLIHIAQPRRRNEHIQSVRRKGSPEDKCEDEAFGIMGSADVAVHIRRSFFTI
jgi:hypothetical protein